MYNGFFGLDYDEFSLLAEYYIGTDIIETGLKSNFLKIKGTYYIITGFDTVICYDRLDISTEIQNDEISQLIFGVEF